MMNIDEIKKMTEESRNKQNERFKASLEKATEMAYNHIMKDASDKIKSAASIGKTIAYIYEWEYIQDKNDKTYTFNNIRIFTIVNKGNLLNKLREKFNPEGRDDGYRVDSKKIYDKVNRKTSYAIYVAWAF